jgi:hypothetical protein
VNTNKPADKRPTANTTKPPPRRPGTVPQRGRASGTGIDRFTLYFIAGSFAAILLFGAVIYNLRALNNRNRIELAQATATPTEGAVATTPIPFPTVTAVYPDALTSGLFATPAPLTSVVSTTAASLIPPPLPPQIPQPRLALDSTTLNLGTVKATGVVTGTALIGNIGARPMIVRALLSDCACLTATAEAANIPPGSRTHLLLQYDPATDPAGSGPQTHKLRVISNDPQGPDQAVEVQVTRP